MRFVSCSAGATLVRSLQPAARRSCIRSIVHGSALLAETLLEHDLIDELRLMVFPVVLGTGKRLFGKTSNKKTLRLVDSRVVGDGIAILIYEPARGATS